MDLFIDEKRITVLEAGQALGEFPIVDPSLNYTVTAVAREQSVIARISEEQFLEIASEHPQMWKNIAKTLIRRLRRRDRRETDVPSQSDRPRSEMTVGDLLRMLKPNQLYIILATVFGILASFFTVAYKMGANGTFAFLVK